MAKQHPLDPLSPDEIRAATTCVRQRISTDGVRSAKVFYATLSEPPKAQVLAALNEGGAWPARTAEVALADMVTGTVFVLKVNLDAGSVVEIERLPEGVHPGITLEELVEAEETVRNDDEVKRLCAEVGVSPEQICCDCWSIGWEDRFPKDLRLQQAFVFARLSPHENLYAHPLDFNAVVDANNRRILAIDFAPHYTGKSGQRSSSTTAPAALEEQDRLAASGRERIPPPMERHDFLPDLIAQAKGDFKLRTDLKPLQVVQPQGVSFKMDGNVLSWYNWSVHIGFNYREGLVLSNVTYFDKDENRVRPIMYRMSVADMVVPYGEPSWPHPRKFAFDIAEYGLGMMAQSLSLGCSCVGAIHYLDGHIAGHDGQPTTIPQCICIHEEDDGILWTHADYRPGGRTQTVRSRKLVIQMTITVANYEYIVAYNFRLDGSIELEIRLTGILNLYTLAEGESAGGFGTAVAPRVQGHHHQHIFSVRLDPMLDGVENSVVETEVHALDEPTGSDANYAGNGFVSQKRVLRTTSEAARQASPADSRGWMIVNENKHHYASGSPVGYKIMSGHFIPLLPKPDSYVARRGPFATKHLWVTPYEDGQLFPSGKYTPQTKDAPPDSLLGWMKGDKPIANKDIVTWLTFGVTHIVRPEDFPVMPFEKIELMLKPVGFFKNNPALDVPMQQDAKSVMAFSEGTSNGTGANGTHVDPEAAKCCS